MVLVVVMVVDVVQDETSSTPFDPWWFGDEPVARSEGSKGKRGVGGANGGELVILVDRSDLGPATSTRRGNNVHRNIRRALLESGRSAQNRAAPFTTVIPRSSVSHPVASRRRLPRSISMERRYRTSLTPYNLWTLYNLVYSLSPPTFTLVPPPQPCSPLRPSRTPARSVPQPHRTVIPIP